MIAVSYLKKKQGHKQGVRQEGSVRVLKWVVSILTALIIVFFAGGYVYISDPPFPITMGR